MFEEKQDFFLLLTCLIESASTEPTIEREKKNTKASKKPSPPKALEISTCLLNNLGKTSQFALTLHSADYPSLAHRHRCPCALNVCL